MKDRMINRSPITVNTYSGPEDPQSFSRTIANVESAWASEFGTSSGMLDLLLSTQLLKRKQLFEQGRVNNKEMLIFEFGCGTGEMMRNFIDDPNQGKLTREVLRQNSDYSIRYVGITDAKKVSRGEGQFNSSFTLLPSEEAIPDETTGQITGDVWYYSVTYNQSLERFFAECKIRPGDIDIAFATATLTYLKPTIFQETLQSIITGLRSEGGKAVVVNYQSMPSRYPLSRGDNYVPPETSLEQLITRVSDFLTSPKQISSEQAEKYVNELMIKIRSAGRAVQDPFFSEEYIQDLVKRQNEDPVKTLKRIMHYTIPALYKHLKHVQSNSFMQLREDTANMRVYLKTLLELGMSPRMYKYITINKDFLFSRLIEKLSRFDQLDNGKYNISKNQPTEFKSAITFGKSVLTMPLDLENEVYVNFLITALDYLETALKLFESLLQKNKLGHVKDAKSWMLEGLRYMNPDTYITTRKGTSIFIEKNEQGTS